MFNNNARLNFQVRIFSKLSWLVIVWDRKNGARSGMKMPECKRWFA